MSAQHKICPRCQRPAALDAPQCAGCGRQFRTHFTAPNDQTVLGPSGGPPPPYAPQYPPPPQYQQTLYPQAAPTKTDVCAILSVVFGGLALGFFCLFGWLFGIAGLTLGIVSLLRIRNQPNLTGSPMAIIGISLSALPVLFGLWMLVIYLSALAAPRTSQSVPQELPAPIIVRGPDVPAPPEPLSQVTPSGPRLAYVSPPQTPSSQAMRVEHVAPEPVDPRIFSSNWNDRGSPPPAGEAAPVKPATTKAKTKARRAPAKSGTTDSNALPCGDAFAQFVSTQVGGETAICTNGHQYRLQGGRWRAVGASGKGVPPSTIIPNSTAPANPANLAPAAVVPPGMASPRTLLPCGHSLHSVLPLGGLGGGTREATCIWGDRYREVNGTWRKFQEQ